MRHDWAQYYDKIENLDTQVGQILKELKDAGLAEKHNHSLLRRPRRCDSKKQKICLRIWHTSTDDMEVSK